LLGLTGAGQTIAVCDTGLDTGNVGTLHPDFTNRVTGYGWSNGAIPPLQLGRLRQPRTHVSGSVLGNGTMSTASSGRGLPGESRHPGLAGRPERHSLLSGELFRQAYTNGARIHSDSWGYDDHGTTTWIRGPWTSSLEQPEFLILIAAGNSGTTRTWWTA
jgi:hypothetical protein